MSLKLFLLKYLPAEGGAEKVSDAVNASAAVAPTSDVPTATLPVPEEQADRKGPPPAPPGFHNLGLFGFKEEKNGLDWS